MAQFKASKLFILCSFIHVIVVSCQSGPQPVDTWFQNINNVPKTAVIAVYGQDVFAGPKQTDYEIARSSITSTSPTSFGQLFMADDLLTAGPDPNSQAVGRAQGLIGYADLNEPALYLSGNFLFQGGPYNGSVISVLGQDPLLSKAREISIVGGTGAFRMARDIIGILMKVRQVTRFERKDKLSFGYRREVILINTMLQTITINLWDDLALNEGQLLKENRIQNSIVAFCNLKMSIYHGFPQLQSTFTTRMLQNPKCNETERINLWLEHIVGKQSLNRLWPAKSIKECEEIKLEQLMEKNISLKQELDETKFPVALDNSIKEEHVILFKMDKEIVKQKKELSIVVEGFQNPFLDIIRHQTAWKANDGSQFPGSQ